MAYDIVSLIFKPPGCAGNVLEPFGEQTIVFPDDRSEAFWVPLKLRVTGLLSLQRNSDFLRDLTSSAALATFTKRSTKRALCSLMIETKYFGFLPSWWAQVRVKEADGKSLKRDDTSVPMCFEDIWNNFALVNSNKSSNTSALWITSYYFLRCMGTLSCFQNRAENCSCMYQKVIKLLLHL